MATWISASDHAAWEKYGLADYGDYPECVEYRNQTEYGDGQLEGEWFYAADEPLPGGEHVIYSGSFGNYNSPGADSYTGATLFDDVAEFKAAVAQWEAAPEYLETEEPEEE